jgi:hypothetical protein
MLATFSAKVLASLVAEAAAWQKCDFGRSGRQQQQHCNVNDNGGVCIRDNGNRGRTREEENGDLVRYLIHAIRRQEDGYGLASMSPLRECSLSKKKVL